MYFFTIFIVPPPEFSNESFQFLDQTFKELETTYSVGKNRLDDRFDKHLSTSLSTSLWKKLLLLTL